VSHGEYADRTDRRTGRRTPDSYITLFAKRGQCKNFKVLIRNANKIVEERSTQSIFVARRHVCPCL